MLVPVYLNSHVGIWAVTRPQSLELSYLQEHTKHIVNCMLT